MEVNGQPYAPADIPPEIKPRYPLGMRLGAPQGPYGRFGEDKNLAPFGIRTPDRTARK
jgi:hypothetical protein